MRSYIALIGAFALFACGDSTNDEEEDTGAGSTSAASTTAVSTTADTGESTGGEEMDWPVGETAGLGEACVWHDDCVSYYCLRYTDVPMDPAAACVENSGWGTMITTGNIRDIRTGEPIGDVNVRILSALGAVANPLIAESLAEAQADASGRFEATSVTTNGTSIGIVAAVEREGYYLTLTALSGPIDESTDYLPGNDVHDIWVVPETDLTDWSGFLTGDDTLAEYLPLGEKGGTVGVVRDEDTGEPIAGVIVESEEGLESRAHIRYLNEEQNGFTEDATTSSGIFVILNADLAEEFDGLVGEDKIGSIVTGSADQSILAGTIQ